LFSPLNRALNGSLVFNDANYSIARIRIINSSGNSSNLADPNAFTGFVVDTHGPKVTAFSPAPTALLTPDSSGKLHFSFTSNKNLDPATVTANSILVTRAGPDGVFGTADDVPVPIDANSVTITPLRNGAQGPELVNFTVSGTLTNDEYSLTLRGTGATPITDIAGNPLNGVSGAGGQDFSTVYVLFSPTVAHTIFVGSPGFITDPTATKGARANPFSSITAGLAAATQGDVVGVLPGVYTERINLKSLVRVASADPLSTDGSIIQGNALQTIIRAPSGGGATVTASGLISVPGLDTEITGFTIASPLLGDPALGVLDSSSTGMAINNSSVLVDRDYFVDSGIGISVSVSGGNAATPRIQDDGLIGNITGVLIADAGNTSLSANGSVKIVNDTIAFNSFGVIAVVSGDSPIIAQISNSIFWQNHDQTPVRRGAGIYASVSNKLIVRNNLFQGNGSEDNASDFSGINVGNGFVASRVGLTPDALGNFRGNPAFVSPRDPRPGSDGPATFFIDANFDLTLASAAIDAAKNSLAPATDFLSRSRVTVPGRGFPGTGPADVGAFEFPGGGGVPAGGAFRVVTTSLAPGGAVHASGASLKTMPNSIVVNFSGRVDRNSVTPNDLVLTGNGLNSFIPAHATSLTWIDNHTVRFNLKGGFNTTGNVKVTIAEGAIKSVTGAPMFSFADNFKMATTSTTARSVVSSSVPQPHIQAATATPTPTPSPTSTSYTPPSYTPAPATPPTAGPAKSRWGIFSRRKGR
jgi:hypothetical protein